MQSSYLMWFRFQGAFYGSLLGEKFSLGNRENQTKVAQLRASLFELLTSSKTLDLNFCQHNGQALSSLTSTQLSLVLLPLILFYHDNLPELDRQMDILDIHLEQSSFKIQLLKAWSRILAAIVRGGTTDENDFFYFTNFC